jgi:two-component system, OmpR family, response regulator
MAKILVVDDDPDVVHAAKLILMSEGHTVESAHNRQSGKEAVASFKPDAMILDVMMEQPDDGIVLAQELRAEGCNVPILMLSAIGKIMGQRFESSAGVNPVDDFVEKPVKPADLVDKINALLAKKEG